MESCALCFRLSGWGEDDPEYVAPDLLPEKTVLAQELFYRLPAPGENRYHYTYTHAFLHKGVMRRLMVQMGRQFRNTALYWQDGLFVDAPEWPARAVIACQRRVDGHPGRGRIALEVWGQGRERFLNWMRRACEQLFDREPAIAQAVSLDSQHWVDVAKLPDARLTGQVVSQAGAVLEVQPFLFLLHTDEAHYLDADGPVTPVTSPPRAPLVGGPPTRSATRAAIYLSYARGDAQETGPSHEAIVDRLYASLLADGYNVKRDTMDLGYKGLISAFMQELGRSDCIVVVLSDKYLKSPFCMFELLGISRHHDFHDRICPIVLADARINRLADRLEYVAYWRDELARLDQVIARVGIRDLSASGSWREYETYREITHHADQLLSYLADINSQTPQALAADDFAALKRAIDARLRQVR